MSYNYIVNLKFVNKIYCTLKAFKLRQVARATGDSALERVLKIAYE